MFRRKRNLELLAVIRYTRAVHFHRLALVGAWQSPQTTPQNHSLSFGCWVGFGARVESSNKLWRVGRVVECAGFESRTRKRTLEIYQGTVMVEAWQSGRTRWFRKPVYPQGYQRFESSRFRHNSIFVWCGIPPTIIKNVRAGKTSIPARVSKGRVSRRDGSPMATRPERRILPPPPKQEECFCAES